MALEQRGGRKINGKHSDGIASDFESNDDVIVFTLKGKKDEDFKEGAKYVCAVEKETGRTRWLRQLEGQGEDIHITDTALFISGADDGVYELSLKTGKTLRTIGLSEVDLFFAKIGPLVESDGYYYIVSSTTSSIVAFDKKTEKQVLSVFVGDDFDAAPEFDDERMIVPTKQGDIYCIDLATAEVAWKYSLGNNIFFKQCVV